MKNIKLTSSLANNLVHFMPSPFFCADKVHYCLQYKLWYFYYCQHWVVAMACHLNWNNSFHYRFILYPFAFDTDWWKWIHEAIIVKISLITCSMSSRPRTWALFCCIIQTLVFDLSFFCNDSIYSWCSLAQRRRMYLSR